MSDVRTASGQRFTRASGVSDIAEELDQIRTAPGAIERARQTVRQSYPRTRPVRHRARLTIAKLWKLKASLAGLALLDIAAFEVGDVPGLVAVGISCFVAEWLAR